MDHTDAASALIDAAFDLRRVLRSHMENTGTDETLPLAQSEVLHDIAAHPGTRLGDIAERLRLRPNTVSTLVKVLTEKKLIDSAADPRDGRARLLHLSAERGARRDRRSERRAAALAAELGNLDTDEYDALLAALPVLNKVNESLRAV